MVQTDVGHFFGKTNDLSAKDQGRVVRNGHREAVEAHFSIEFGGQKEGALEISNAQVRPRIIGNESVTEGHAGRFQRRGK